MKKRSLNLTLAVFAVFMLSFFLQPEKAEAAGVTELTIGDEDILTDADHTIQCGGGTAVYDPAADTLTLNNATIDCTFGQADSTIGAVEFRGSLKLVLNGENKITCDSSGILGDDGDLYISGEGHLELTYSAHAGEALQKFFGAPAGQAGRLQLAQRRRRIRRRECNRFRRL